jgi:hypothetical protein
MGTLFILLAIIGSIGLAALFFGSLVAMLAALGNRKWLWFTGILLTIPLASTLYSIQLTGDQRWVLKMLVAGWLMLLPLLLFLTVIYVANGFVLPFEPRGFTGLSPPFLIQSIS